MPMDHEHEYVNGRCECGEWLIPRCPIGCGLARHKRTCEEAAETLGVARAMLDRAADEV